MNISKIHKYFRPSGQAKELLSQMKNYFSSDIEDEVYKECLSETGEENFSEAGFFTLETKIILQQIFFLSIFTKKMMETTVNEILEKFDSLSIEDQESILEIERKRLTQKKRESLIEEVKKAEKEIQEGKYISGNVDTLMKAIEDESKTDK